MVFGGICHITAQDEMESDSGTAGEDYRPMIREDRVWEYLQTNSEYGSEGYHIRTDSNTLLQMKFNGTEELNGKEYHRFVYCGDRVSWTTYTDHVSGITFSTDTVTVPDDDTAVCYLREEPGKVFILFPYDTCADFAGSGSKAVKGEEVLLYDFTLTDGESFTGFWSSGNLEGGLIDYPVRKLDPVKVAGEECRTFGVTDNFQGACRGYRFAEEAGCLNCGTLVAPYPLARKTGFTTADCRLQRIYDAEGKVLYRNDSDFWTAEESEYVPMLKEGRVWVWNAVDLSQQRDDIPVYFTVVGQEEISGRNYYRIRQTSELKELNGHEHLLREENRMVVYHLRNDIEFSNDVPLYDFYAMPGHKFQVYDADADDRYIYEIDPFNTMEITAEKKITVGGKAWRKIELMRGYEKDRNAVWVEGIGAPYVDQMLTRFGSDNFANGIYVHSFRECIDNGETIFTMSDFGNTLSVDMLPSDEYRSRCDAPVYDMMGRRVTSMVRGGIYVRDGKKFVGK